MDYIEVFNQLDHWLKRQRYKSYDLCDVTSHPLFLTLSSIKKNVVGGNVVTYPFFYLAKRKSRKFRKVFQTEKKKYPQAQGIITRAYLKMYHSTGERKYVNSAREILQWLTEHRVKSVPHHCWGQPYDWYSGKVIPKNTPRTTVTSQVSHAFLDMYEETNEKRCLNTAIDACRFYLDDLTWDMDAEGDISFPYTTEDTYHIHNANILAASVLIRTWYHSRINEFLERGMQALQFTLKHQNEDGSWYYWAPPDPIKDKIDNYHTGFVLESIAGMKHYLGDMFKGDQNYRKGANYYISKFFEDGHIPKMAPESVYPIDIQSCAQSLITLGEIHSEFSGTTEKMIKVVDWTIDNMFDADGFFYYRIYGDGKIDKNPYIRWGESWMLRALSLVISQVENK